MTTTTDKIPGGCVDGTMVCKAVFCIEAFATLLTHEWCQPGMYSKVPLKGCLFKESLSTVFTCVGLVLGVLLPDMATKSWSTHKMLITIFTLITLDTKMVQGNVVTHVVFGQKTFPAIFTVMLVASHSLVHHLDVTTTSMFVFKYFLT